MKINPLSLKIAALCVALLGSVVANAAPVTIVNGTPWTDTTGGSIQAHAGCIIKVGSVYYWYGEDKIQNNALFNHVCCYSSTDLKNWKWESFVLRTTSAPELARSKIERPKVIFNSSTGKYVMWMHYENAADYSLARVAVASSNTPTGAFTYHGSFRPTGIESRDMTLFKDDNGSAYLVSSTRNNYDLALFQLSSDYLSIASRLANPHTGLHREAPAVVKKNGVYFLITSGASGWYPNQQQYSTATSMNGPWTAPVNIGNSSGFFTQTSGIVTIQGSSTTSYFYMGDRWNSAALGTSRYVWLPLALSGTTASFDYYDSITIDAAAGSVNGVSAGVLLSQGKPATAQSVASGSSANAANDGNYGTRWVASSVSWPHWWRVDLGATRSVRNVQISWYMVNGSEGFYKYKIETSTNGTSWTVALDRTGNTTYGFTSDSLNTSARYVRINMVDADLWNNPGNWYTPQIWEVKIFGN